MRKFLFLSIILLTFVSTAEAQFGLWKKSSMMNPMEDFRISEKINYPKSPFNRLVKKAFADPEKNLHYVYLLEIGDEALTSRIHWIRNAQKSINIQTFIWRNDESGRYVAYELIEAAKRGVKVNIIIDAIGAIRDPALAAFLAQAHPNLQIKYYNPNSNNINPSRIQFIGELATNFKSVNQRMHNKTFIVDDRMCITGGRNYENDYFDRGEVRNFKDRDIMIIGPVVHEITDSFAEYWAFKLSVNDEDLNDVKKLLDKGDFPNFKTRGAFELGDLFDDTDQLANDSAYIKSTFVDPLFEIDKIRFVSDKPGKNNKFGLRGGGVAGVELLNFLDQAKNSIVFQTPYLVLDRQHVKEIRKLIKKNPDLSIKVSSNSLASTDHIHTYAFAYKQKKLFVKKLNWQIFELKPVPEDIQLMMPRYVPEDDELKWDVEELAKDGSILERSKNIIPEVSKKATTIIPEVSKKATKKVVDTIRRNNNGNEMESKKRHLCIHGKSFVVDSQLAWVGSFNVDPRSANLNTELGIIIDDEQVARAVEDNILRDMAPQNSWTIGKRQEIPVISKFSGLVGNLMELTPVIDVWPFRYTSSFELKEDGKVVPYFHPDFYDNYTSVGSFPGVGLSVKEIQIRLIKAFAGFAQPII